jgi:FMN phosphatase YigB (HAD superfamily)
MKKPVKNIIFDLGGVLLNIDYDAPIREFTKLGIQNFAELYSKASQAQLFDELETGRISPQVFREQIRTITASMHTDEQIDSAWNSILLDFPSQNKHMLFELKSRYRLFLLSNTNEIHINCFEGNLGREHSANFFPDVFENIYYSSRIGLRKPDVDAFDYVLQHNGLSPHETIFIDDSAQHIEGALKIGLNAFWLDLKQTNTINLVKELGL